MIIPEKNAKRAVKVATVTTIDFSSKPPNNSFKTTAVTMYFAMSKNHFPISRFMTILLSFEQIRSVKSCEMTGQM